MSFETKLFNVEDNVITYEELMKKIYLKSEYRDRQIERVVEHINSVIQNSSDAVVLAPAVAKYLETAVKNDDNLVKLAGIVSRLIKPANVKSPVDDDGGLTDAMKREIMLEAEEILKKNEIGT